MIETIITILLIIYGCSEEEPLLLIAAGIFAVAVNIGKLGECEKGKNNDETNEH